MAELFAREKFQRVIHLAAQAGVRYSHPESAGVHRQQCRGLREHPRRLPAQQRRASRLCIDQLGVRREHEDAVLRASERRSSVVVLCRDQEGERADGAHLRAPVPAAGDGPALLHRLRSVGPAGHGAVPVHEEHPRGQADRRLQLRQSPSRLHLRRRHRAGRRARDGSRRGRERRDGTATIRIRARARRRIGSTTSATTSPSS